MTSVKINFILGIIEENFGNLVKEISYHILVNGQLTLKAICFYSKKSTILVKECLKTLIQHNLVIFNLNSRKQYEYKILTNNVISILRYSKYVLVGSYLEPICGETIIEELIKSGKIELDDLIEKTIKNLSNDPTIKDKYELPKLIYNSFVNLVNKEYITNDLKTKHVSNLDFTKFHQHLNIKIENDDNDNTELEPKTKRQKTCETNSTEKSIFWFINNEKFDFYLRGLIISETIKNYYDDSKAGEIAKIIYFSDNLISRNQIINKVLDSNICNEINEVDSFLKIFDQDLNNRFIYKAENTSDGGRYSINFLNIFQSLTQKTFSTIVNDNYGEKSSRIFKLILNKKYLQQKNIGELAMVSVKDAKERVSTLLKDNFLKVLQYSKTPDYTPMKTSFVLSIDLNSICLNYINKCYHALHSLYLRKKNEFLENKVIIEKKTLIDTIIQNYKDTDKNEEQINELDQSFSTHEKSILSRYEKLTNKIELCELEVEKTLFLLTSYLNVKKSSKISLI